MDQLHSNMNIRQKGKHLTFEDRVTIQVLRKQGKSLRFIARELNCSPSTVMYELRKGQISLYHGKKHRYDAKTAQIKYEDNRANCGRKLDFLVKHRFIDYVEQNFFGSHKWSLDAIWGEATATGKFTSKQAVCSKTLYNYVERGLLKIKPTDLPEKLSRNTKIKRVRKNKKKLGRSIEERDPAIAKRLEFGHWECDLVLGNKTKDDEVLLTFYERMTRMFFIIKIKDKTAASVMAALENLRQEYGEHWNEIFKTITTDNGSEFADLSQLEQISETLVYFAHPYTACDKGGVECHNRLIRRFIPKGQAIKKWALTQISEIQEWCNGLPRKILAYHTPEELFDRELDRIYQVSA
ncbi:IS30 family transposase [Lactobacillus sp. ESL0791]|uniref:IS30 family transposase n=1 Tax=Lactobacillus sp. ESL0791 TaxID=2983234 RepID=UPI0023F6ED5B|nr:IS30 family transposase [Lactobacillus sp. ESL0791]MDF7638165.1 IS30 family transposase [Lactobacillus sp. ESL0791]